MDRRVIKNRQDFYGGLIFLAFGLFGLTFGTGYALGSISRMGPGYLPVVLSAALSAVGAFLSFRALVFGESRIEPCRWRPLVFILGSILAFAAAISRGGVVLAVFLVAFLSAFGNRHARWAEALLMAVFMAGLTVLLFVKLLGLPFSVWPR
jgi:putative tricarboxylic transport membrane protein